MGAGNNGISSSSRRSILGGTADGASTALKNLANKVICDNRMKKSNSTTPNAVVGTGNGSGEGGNTTPRVRTKSMPPIQLPKGSKSAELSAIAQRHREFLEESFRGEVRGESKEPEAPGAVRG